MTSVLGCLLLFGLCSAGAYPQGLRLSVRLNDSVYFEGEPVYFLAELRNESSDTIWTSPPGFVFGTLRGTLEMDGQAVPEYPITADYLAAAGERGTPLGPGESMYETHILLARWGFRGPLTESLFLRNLAPGAYVFSVAFVPDAWVKDAALHASSEPLRFRVRGREADEERLYRMAGELGAVAWDRARRDGFVQQLIVRSRARLAIDSADPFVPFFLKAGVEIARGLGLRLSDADTRDLIGLQLAVARQHRTSSVGALLTDAEPLRSSSSGMDQILSLDDGGLLRSVAAARGRGRTVK